MALPDNLIEQLAAALRKRLEIINDQKARESDPSSHLAALGKISAEIECLANSLPEGSDPRLLHFLKRASYSKALEFLENKKHTSLPHH